MAHLLATVALATDTFVSQTGHQMAYNLSVTNGAGPTMAIVTSLKDSAGRFHCLDLYGQNPANGTRVDVWTCVSPPIPGQMWFFDTNSYAIRSLVDPKMCVDTGNMTVGTQLSISPCVKAKDSQRIGWNESGSLYLVPPQKKPPLGLCFEPKHDASGNVTNGSAVALQNCSEAHKPKVAQEWRVNLPPDPVGPNQTFMFRVGWALSPTKEGCLNASAGAPNGYPVTIVKCKDEPSQKWVFAGGSYMIRSAAHPGQCLDAGGMQLGQSFLTTWACNRLPQQQWSYSQQRVFLGNKARPDPHDGACLNYKNMQGHEGIPGPTRAMLGNCTPWNLTAA